MRQALVDVSAFNPHPWRLERVNHFVLGKQHLSAPSPRSKLLQVVADIGGLHATGAVTPYLSLFARLSGFKRTDLERELYQRRTLARIRCVRGTIYVHPREQLPVVFSATVEGFTRASQKYLESRGVSRDEYQNLCGRILELLAHQELTTAQIKAALKSDKDISSVVNLMGDEGYLVRSQPAKGWRDIHFRYARLQDYFPELKLRVDQAQAVAGLVGYYLAAFGPVTLQDIVWWTGLGKTKIQGALKQLDQELIRVNIAGLEPTFLLLRPQLEALEQTQVPERPVINVLPAQDPYLMGYKERARYLDPAYYDYIFDRGGNATATILLDGRVVGVWDFESEPAPVIKFFLFKKLSPGVRAQLCEKLAEVGRFMLEREADLKTCNSMIPLTKQTMSSFQSPLKLSKYDDQ